MYLVNNFVDVFKNHYFDFEGRAPRKQFWMFVLAYIIVSIVISLIDLSLGLTYGGQGQERGIISTIFALGALLPMLALYVRRLHDLDHSGWWILLGFVPLVNIALLIYMAFKGTEGPNRFGPDPCGGSMARGVTVA